MSLQWTDDDDTHSRSMYEQEYNFKQDPWLDRRYRRAIRSTRAKVIEFISMLVVALGGSVALWWLMTHCGGW